MKSAPTPTRKEALLARSRRWPSAHAKVLLRTNGIVDFIEHNQRRKQWRSLRRYPA